MNISNLPEFLQKILDWLTFADYYAAKEQGVLKLISRYSRRNVSAQSGWLLDDRGLVDLSKASDRAVASLNSLASSK